MNPVLSHKVGVAFGPALLAPVTTAEACYHWIAFLVRRLTGATLRSWRASLVPIRDANGKVLRCFATNTDITTCRNPRTIWRLARRAIEAPAALFPPCSFKAQDGEPFTSTSEKISQRKIGSIYFNC